MNSTPTASVSDLTSKKKGVAMLKNSFPLMRTLGIQVKVHWSWLILAFLITSSLAASWFPNLAPGHSTTSYWMAGVLGAVGLFISIVIHEFSHAVVGRAYKMPIENITLFLFGGVAQLEDEPPSPKAEFQMAIAGPIASVVLALLFFGFHWGTLILGGPVLLQAVFSYLTSINLVVAVFNMLPGFPLDGGRVLRSILWHFKKDLLWATRIASGIGQGFGWLLMILGFVTLFANQNISGIWSIFLGLLLMVFARSSYLQLLIKQSLHGKPATTFMDSTPITVSPQTPVSELMREYLNHSEQTLYPVVTDDHTFVGCADLNRAREFPENEWGQHHVREITRECSVELQIAPEIDAEAALNKMSKTGYKELAVVSGNHLVGILHQNALIRYVTFRPSQV